MHAKVLWPVALCLAVVATNRHAGPPGPDFVMPDAYSYQIIAQAAPGLPRQELLFHHSQRIALPFSIGLLHRAVPISLHALFQIAGIAIAMATLLLLAEMLELLSVHRRAAVLVLAIFAFNPWGFRAVLTFPEMINDLGFALGVAILLRGLLTGQGAVVLLGQLVASLTRQTGLVLLPFVALWLWRDREMWGPIPARQRVTLGIAVAAVAAAVYEGTAALAAGFSGANQNVDHLLGGIRWLATGFDVDMLASFAVRALALPAIPLACLAATVGARRRDGRASHTVPLLVFASLSIWAQPLLTGPGMEGGNVQRLMAIGLLPLCLALGIVFRDGGFFTTAKSLGRWSCAVVFVVLGSFHHWYVMAEVPSFRQMAVFVALYTLACAVPFVATRLEARDLHRSTDNDSRSAWTSSPHRSPAC